ncbi:Uncharacterised protein [uncultured archaeon]|nr:Uncharacterised protein [uncultured archaeon]
MFIFYFDLRPELLAQVLLKLDELEEPHRRLEFNEQVNVAFLGLLFSCVGAEDADRFYFEVLFEGGSCCLRRERIWSLAFRNATPYTTILSVLNPPLSFLFGIQTLEGRLLWSPRLFDC